MFTLCFAANETASQADNSPEAEKGMSTSIQQDSLLVVVGQLKSFFSFNPDQAVAFELDGGPRVLRLNGTYGFALNDNNRVKLTAEYLGESLDFNFVSGDTMQWVQQGAIGAAYQYFLEDNTVQDISIGTHYSHAQSKDLSDKTIITSDQYSWIDQRRIAGGNDLNGNAEAGLQLWKDGAISLGPDYDRVRYDTQYETADEQNAQGFGGHVRLEQRLKNNLGLQLNSTVSQLFDTYGAGLNWVWKSNENTALSTGLNSSYTQDHTTDRNFWINAISVSIVWDVAPEQKETVPLRKLQDAQMTEPLSKWVQTPAVRMPDVLAISDERLVQVGSQEDPFVSITGVCPLATEVQYANGNYSASGGWYQSYPQGTITPYPIIALDSANIMSSPSGAVSCFYNLYNGVNRINLILQNNLYKNAVGVGAGWGSGVSNYWPQSQPTPASYCPATSTNCAFSTVEP